MLTRLVPIRRRSLGGAAMIAALAAVTTALVLVNGDGGARGIEAASVPQVVLAQFDENTDTIAVAPLDDPAATREVTAIRHAPGWGIIGAVSPDGRWLAYTVLPRGARYPQTQAEAHILSLTSGDDRRVADGVDLQAAPVWSRASDRAAFLRGAAPENQLGSFTVLVATPGGSATEGGIIDGALAAHPVGFSPAGDAVYVAVIEPSGARLDALAGNGRSALARLSDGLARDFALSPDGRKLAYVDTAPSAGAPLRVRVIDLAGGLSASAVAPAAPGVPTLGPAWTPDGELTFAVARPGGAALRAASAAPGGVYATAAAGRADGFYEPLAWSPDGVSLAARAITGSLGEVREQRLALVGGPPDGRGRRDFGNADTKFLGWVPAGVGR